MTQFILLRHGKATYKDVEDNGFIGHGLDLAPLSEVGRNQIIETCHSDVLISADLIISSPYTRALHSASILSRQLNLPIEVEVDLHEWIPDIINHDYKNTRDCVDLYHDYMAHDGVYPEGDLKVWESKQHIINRVENVLKRYKNFKKVIVVTHGMVVSTMTTSKIDNGEFVVLDR